MKSRTNGRVMHSSNDKFHQGRIISEPIPETPQNIISFSFSYTKSSLIYHEHMNTQDNNSHFSEPVCAHDGRGNSSGGRAWPDGDGMSTQYHRAMLKPEVYVSGQYDGEERPGD